MWKARFAVLATLGLIQSSSGQYADAVLNYTPGCDAAAGYTNALMALSEPSRSTPGRSISPVTPFAPAWQTNQLVSIGAGGTLTLQFNTPIHNDPGHAFGIDFIVFGNSGFTITNGNYSGGGITDGSLFGHNNGTTRVSVSPDGTNFYVLDPTRAPAVDAFFPTDGIGNFFTPVIPELRNFAGKDLAGIRELYAASGGGTGFDLAWAQNASGQSVSLMTANFVRIDVLSGKSEIDAVVALPRQTTTEDFVSDPLQRGWRVFGATNLFRWNAADQQIEATWDSSQPNSYFQFPLGTMLTRYDDFSVGFDLLLNDVAAGINPNRPSTFPLAIGLQNRTDAAQTNFLRSTGLNSPNLVEFNFFADTGFGPTVWPAIWSTNSRLTYNGASDFMILNLPVAVRMRISMSYSASNSALVTTITTNGTALASAHRVTLSTNFTDFRVDTFAIESYAEPRSAAEFGGSLLAHGIVDNVVITLPPAPVQLLRGTLQSGQWTASFLSRTNWNYTLEAAEDLRRWKEVSPTRSGTGTLLELHEINSLPAAARFYRIKSQRAN